MGSIIHIPKIGLGKYLHKIQESVSAIRNKGNAVRIVDPNNKEAEKETKSSLPVPGTRKPIIVNGWILRNNHQDIGDTIAVGANNQAYSAHKKVLTRSVSASYAIGPNTSSSSPFIRRKSDSAVQMKPRSDEALRAIESYQKALANLNIGQSKYEQFAEMHLKAARNKELTLDKRMNHYINAVQDFKSALRENSLSASKKLESIEKEIKPLIHLGNSQNTMLGEQERISEFNKAIVIMQQSIFEGKGSIEDLQSTFRKGLPKSENSQEYLVPKNIKASQFWGQVKGQYSRLENMEFNEALEYSTAQVQRDGTFKFHTVAMTMRIAKHYRDITDLNYVDKAQIDSANSKFSETVNSVWKK